MGAPYSKAKGSSGSKGTQFQLDLLYIVTLNAFRLDLKNWKLSTENTLAEKFDDLVLEFDDGAILFQAKHKENRSITLHQLYSSNPQDFSLPKYFLSYLGLRTKFKIKHLIICTNTRVDEEVSQVLKENEVDKENILQYQDEISYFSFSNDIVPDLVTNTINYLQNNSRCNITESWITEDSAKEFLKHLQFYLNYPSGSDLKEAIELLLSSSRSFNNLLNDISYCDIYPKMKLWMEQSKGKYLTKNYAKAMLCEIKTEKYREWLNKYKVTFNNVPFEITSSEERIFHIVAEAGHILYLMAVYDNLNVNKTKVLYTDSRHDKNVQKEIIQAFELPAYTTLIIASPTFSNDSEINEIYVILRDILKKGENKKNGHSEAYKKIIFIAEQNNKLFQKMKYIYKHKVFHESLSLADLSNESQKLLLKKRNIHFQGKFVNLEELLPKNNDEYKIFINSDILEKLILEEKFPVGTEFPPWEEDYYINRKFEKIANNNREIVEPISEEGICNVNDKIILISESSGMGKTTVLKKLADMIKKKNPPKWVIRIELNQYTYNLNKFLSTRKPIHILAMLNHKLAPMELTNKLEKFIFSLESKVLLMLDGVDEISPRYTKLIVDLLLQCQKDKNVEKVFIATRPHMAKELKIQLSIKASFKLVPLTEEDQVDFLTRHWAICLRIFENKKIVRIQRYARTLIRKVSIWIRDWYNDQKFTASPLHIRMLADVFLTSNNGTDWKGCREYLEGDDQEPKLPDKMNIVNLYEKCIETKREIFFNKTNPTHNSTTAQVLQTAFEQYLTYHSSLALKMIVGKEEDCALFSCYNVEMDHNIEEILLKIGIVQKPQDQFTFIHMTFAEYFVARSILKRLELQNPDIRFERFLIDEVFFKPSYQVIRQYLNNLLCSRSLSIPPNTFQNYISLVNDTYNPYLIHSLAEEGNTEIIRLVLKLINLFDFCLLCRRGPLACYRLLFMKRNTLNLVKYSGGIDVRLDGLTLLHRAVIGGNLDTVEFLVKRGADVNRKSLVNKEASEILKLNFKKGILERYKQYNPNIKDDFMINNAHPALHFAVACDLPDMVKLLVEYKMVDINSTDDNGNTAVHFAAMNGHFDTFQLLAEHGANIFSVNKFGKTALHFAAEVGSFGIVEYITNHNVEINTPDNEGKTAVQLAKYGNHLKLVSFLRNHTTNSGAGRLTNQTFSNFNHIVNITLDCNIKINR